MQMFSSPPTATLSAPDIETFDLDAEEPQWEFLLNPNATAFVPRCSGVLVDAEHARKIEDAMQIFHHQLTVNDSDSLAEANAWLGTDPSEWVSNGAQYIADEAEAHLHLDTEVEQQLCEQLHQRPRQPKGNRSGRARSKGTSR